jgi:hypothetical protein
MNKLQGVQVRLFNKSKVNFLFFSLEIEAAMTLRLGKLAIKLFLGLFDVNYRKYF